MRIRLLLAGAAVALLAVLGAPGIAHAQESDEPAAEEHDFADHAAEECFELLEGGAKVDECVEAPSPIVPATDELIWGILSFTILFIVLWKFGYPAIRKGMNDRTERIRSDLDRADTAKTEAEAELANYQSQLKGAREEATRLRDDARAEMDEYKIQRRADIDAELNEYRERAKAEADAAKTQALADVKSEVAALAIGAAEQVVQKSLDQATNVALVESYINSVDSRG
jgi:F-type H+-transporting ATPase subunit b